MNETFKYIVFSAYAIIFLTFLSAFLWGMMRREKNILKMKSDLKTKLSNGLQLSSKDIVILGRAHDLSPSNSRLALYRVYRDIDESDSFNHLKSLVHEIEKEEPFDTMPDEVKPSLLRISEISSKSENDSDKHLLTPITNVLTKFVELKEEQKKSRKQTTIAYVVSIVSFVIGAMSLYFALKAPTAAEIAKQLEIINNN